MLYLVARFLRRRHLLYVVAAFVIITTAIAWRHYYHGDWIVDLFMFRQALWTTLHGQGFFHVSDEGGSHFGTHNTPLLFLFLPLYAIWDSGALLLLCQSAAVGLTAYPMYHIARARVDEPRAMVLAVGFLLLVPVIGPTLTWFKELPFALPLFAAALAAFEERRLKGFAAWSGSLLVVRETLAVTLVLFGLYAAVRRRSWRWVALPAALGLAWGALSFGVIMPRFFVPGQSNRPFLALYKGLGESMPEVLLTAATHPRLAAARLNTHENRQYLERLTRPCGRFLPLGSVLTVFAIPDGLAVGLARHRAWPTHELAANYHVIMIAALVAAFVCTVAGLTQRLGLSAAPLHLALGLFFISAVTDALPVLYDPPRAQVWPPDLVRARREIVALVPPQASVAATYCTLTQLAHRREIYPAVPLVRESEGVRQISPDVMVLMGEVENRKLMERMRQEGYRLAAERPPFTLWAKPGVALPR